jgi:hypothetical protein
MPPMTAAIVCFAGISVLAERISWELARMTLLVAYTLALVPSIAYSCVMEVAFTKGLHAGSWRAVGLSSVLGACAGLVISLVLAGQGIGLAPAILLAPLGLFVGALQGVLTKVAFITKA